MDIQVVLRRVSALRNLAAKAGTIHEAETAAAKADALIQKYRLSEADVESAGAAPTEKPAAADPLHTSKTRTPMWLRLLAQDLAKHYGCFAWTQMGGAYSAWTLRIVGRPSDVEVVRYMFAWISTEIARLSQAEHGKADQNAFRLGAIAGIRNALYRSTKETTDAHPIPAAPESAEPTRSAAMVLLSRVDESKKEAERIVGKFISGSGAHTRGSSGSYNRGRKAGEGMHVGKSLPGASRMLTS